MAREPLVGNRLGSARSRNPQLRCGDRPIRVVSVARMGPIGGDQNRLLQTALAFDRTTVEHTVLIVDSGDGLSDGESARWQDMLDDYAEAGTEVVNLSPGHSLRYRTGASPIDLVRRIYGEFRRRRPDVVDARMGMPGTLALPAAKAARVPVLTLTAYYPSLFAPPIRYLLGQAVLQGIDALISDARATLDDFDAWRWTGHAELVLIPNGIRPADSTLTRREARAALGLPAEPGTTVIGQISRVIPRKAFDLFLHAARLVLDVRPDVHFAVIGFVSEEDRAYLQALRDLAAQLDIADSVTFVSHPGPVGDAFRSVDIFAHLSHADSSPFAIHEAMSAGTPSVITALPGNLEIVTDEVTGLLVPPADAAAAAGAFLRLVDDPELAERLGAGALERYRERHTPETMAQAHVDLYRRLLAAKAGRRHG